MDNPMPLGTLCMQGLVGYTVASAQGYHRLGLWKYTHYILYFITRILRSSLIRSDNIGYYQCHIVLYILVNSTQTSLGVRKRTLHLSVFQLIVKFIFGILRATILQN